MKIAFYTLGCKVNQYETEAMRELFLSNGHTVEADDGDADVYIINSCTVTAESDRKTRQTVRKFRKSNPAAVIVLTGCMVQAFPDDADSLPEVDIVVGNTDLRRILTLVENYNHSSGRIIEISEHKPRERFNTPVISSFSERTRAFMKIEDGCDRFCSYCIIPSARGRVRSKSITDIKNEAEKLAGNGFSEIVLVGINLSAYGKNEDFDLCDAVDAVCAVEGVKRVRLGSLEPDHISDEMLERFKNQKKFCPQFHLSLQSGCDETLTRMNRHYDSLFYYDLVSRIRNMFADSSITTDIMVGFAGETEEEFRKSIDFVKNIGFAKSHVFAYSRRSGTKAYDMPNQLTKAVKEARSRKMITACAESEKNFLELQVGKIYPVLFEYYENNLAYGYTPNYSRVAVETKIPIYNKIIDVEIVSAESDYCIGKLV